MLKNLLTQWYGSNKKIRTEFFTDTDNEFTGENTMSFIIQPFIVGALFTNCYIVACTNTKKAAIIDPGTLESHEIIEFIKKENLDIAYIINTHGHADHTAGNTFIKKAFPDSKLLIHPTDNKMLRDPLRNLSQFYGHTIVSPMADRLINEDDIIEVGDLKLKVIHTPGHTQGSISLVMNESHIFSGDTLFAQSIGRTDLPGGYYPDIISSVKNKLFNYADSCNVYPGHGENTTIGREKQSNPYVK